MSGPTRGVGGGVGGSVEIFLCQLIIQNQLLCKHHPMYYRCTVWNTLIPLIFRNKNSC